MTDHSIDSNSGKYQAARAAAGLVEDGMTVGLGSGSTAAMVVRALGERVSDQGLRFVGVPTSVSIAELARSLRLTLRELDDVESIDLNIDGADEIDPQFRMIKGRGGALLREKIVASFASRRVTVITPEKRVERLGLHAPLPIEVSPVGVHHLVARLGALRGEARIRLLPDGSRYVTDGGNVIVDLRLPSIDDPNGLDSALQRTVGVFETGLFIDLCDLLVIGHGDRVEMVESESRFRG